jgi:hypothetical protein
MSLVQEIEKIIAELPPRKACILKFWLKEYKASRRHKQIRAYAVTVWALRDFQKNNGDASLN